MYQISIKQLVTKRELSQGTSYVVIGQRLMTESDISGSAYSSKDELREKLLAGTPVKFDVRGYPPAIETETEKEVVILSQTIEELDLPAVIKAINKIP